MLSLSQKGHPFPAAEAWMLDNWIRRLLQPPSQLVGKLGILPDDVVMDFGCGPGYYTIEIAKRARAAIAVDISSEMLQKAQNKATKSGIKNIQFLQSDGKQLQPSESSVDKILLVTVYHELADSHEILKEFRRILKPQGFLVIVEVVKKMLFVGAPIQNPENLKSEIQAEGFAFLKMLPYKSFGMLFFAKT